MVWACTHGLGSRRHIGPRDVCYTCSQYYSADLHVHSSPGLRSHVRDSRMGGLEITSSPAVLILPAGGLTNGDKVNCAHGCVTLSAVWAELTVRGKEFRIYRSLMSRFLVSVKREPHLHCQVYSCSIRFQTLFPCDNRVICCHIPRQEYWACSLYQSPENSIGASVHHAIAGPKPPCEPYWLQGIWLLKLFVSVARQTILSLYVEYTRVLICWRLSHGTKWTKDFPAVGKVQSRWKFIKGIYFKKLTWTSLTRIQQNTNATIAVFMFVPRRWLAIPHSRVPTADQKRKSSYSRFRSANKSLCTRTEIFVAAIVLSGIGLYCPIVHIQQIFKTWDDWEIANGDGWDIWRQCAVPA